MFLGDSREPGIVGCFQNERVSLIYVNFLFIEVLTCSVFAAIVRESGAKWRCLSADHFQQASNIRVSLEAYRGRVSAVV